MFSAALSAAGAKAPSAARGFATSTSRMSGRKFFVGGNWKCNGSVAKVGRREVSLCVSDSLAAARDAAVQVELSDKTHRAWWYGTARECTHSNEDSRFSLILRIILGWRAFRSSVRLPV